MDYFVFARKVITFIAGLLIVLDNGIVHDRAHIAQLVVGLLLMGVVTVPEILSAFGVQWAKDVAKKKEGDDD